MRGRILVTGGNGQLAGALSRADPSLRVVGRPDFDFDRPSTLAAVLDAYAPSLVVNAAAWTAVDAAETSPDAAAQANAVGPGLLAAQCHARRIDLVHISTDYVFDGLKGAPYTEADATNPTGVYGRTKLAGERAVQVAHPDAIILRTSWVYAQTGKNFVLTMLNAGKRAPVLRVVSDQIGCPTNADDLAEATLAICDRLSSAGHHQAGHHQARHHPDGEKRLAGIYHAAGYGEASWHGFATAIFEAASRHGWPRPEVAAIATADWPTPARRPPDSRLDCSKLETVFGVRLPRWEASLGRAVAAICGDALPAGGPQLSASGGG